MTGPDQELDGLRAAVAAVPELFSVPGRVHNRLMTAAYAEGTRLLTTASGRAALRRAAQSDADPDLRRHAAARIGDWDRQSGAEARGAEIVAVSERVVRPMSMAAALAIDHRTGRSAAMQLYELDRDD